MEEITVETRASSEALAAAENSAVPEQEDSKKGGKASRKKEESRKKDKKKAAKKAKKAAAKHSKDKGALRDADTSPNRLTSSQTDHRDDVDDLQTGGGSGGDLGNNASVPSGNQDGVCNDPARMVHEHPSQRGASASAAIDPSRRDSGIEDESPRHDAAATNNDGRLRGGQDQAEGEAAPRRSKSRSRSGSRRRFGLFRRRGRSEGRGDRSKSETDISGVAEGGDAGKEDTTSPREMKARNANSLDRGKGRYSSASAGRNRENSARLTASLERDAYRRYDPTIQPRTRLQHMTVKDAVSEYRHRHNTPATKMSSAERRREGHQRTRSVSDTDVSHLDGGHDDAGGYYHLDPHEATLVKAVATLPRHSRAVRETALLDDADDLPGGRHHPGSGAGGGDSSVQERRNLGEQILDICRTISQGRDIDSGVDGARGEGCDSNSNSNAGANRLGPADDIPRNTSTVIFINPNDIVTDPSDNLPLPSPGPRPNEKSAAAQAALKPSEQFMELRKAVPLFSHSTAARERRISQSGDTSPAPSDRRTSQSRDSFKSQIMPRNVSPAQASSKDASSVTPTNIPTPKAKDLVNPPSVSCATSPTITVNQDQVMSDSGIMDTSMTMNASMISSTDSGKRSSDQGFSSEPRESDTESEGDTSGFSTPPEELDSPRGSNHSSLSPTVFVNTISNRLEVPRSKAPYKRSVSDGVRKVDNVEALPRSSSVDRNDSFKSDSVLVTGKQKPPPSSSPSDLQGALLYQHKKGDLRASNEGSESSAKQETVEQKTVPVMGTSVQQKYRRTFSPVRNRGRAQSQESVNASVEPSKDANTAFAVTKSSKRLESFLTPEPALTTDSPKEGEKRETQGEAKAERGREPKRRRGILSHRSFRRKSEKENKEPESHVKAEPKSEPQQEEQNVRDDSPEGTSGRLAFQDKSIQTSETLLNELIKKSKKRKVSLFSSSGKKSKRDRTPTAVAEIPADVPPPKYEEQRPVVREPDIQSSSVQGSQNVPLNRDRDVVDSGLARLGEREPEAVPLVGHAEEEPVTEQQQQQQPEENADAAKKKPAKSKGTSLRAIVALKQKLARNRKKKEEKVKKEEENKVEDDLPSDTFITIENELNLSKLAEIKETDILDDEIFEPDYGMPLPKKQLRFEPIASDEAIQSEEPLPPLPRSSRRLTARRSSTRGRERRKKCIHCCKQFVAFLFSHIGLISLVVGYTIMGGFIFKALESPFERAVKFNITKNRTAMQDRIISLATGFQLNEVTRDNLTKELDKELKKYQAFIHKHTTENNWDGNEYLEGSSGVQVEQWSFASALLYAITVMTTIGEYWVVCV
ncbi:dentin sialophosphoprotein-like [Littorina saxatilis]|uniref:Uncharacterized protein n=1 Tax=Littorina saxatilis TaxID=31220 RepID=A0AAN9FWE7_9CAEN